MEVFVALEVMLAALRGQADLKGLSIEPVVGANLPHGISVRHVGPGADDKVQPLETLMSRLTFYVVLALPGNAMSLQAATYLRAIHGALEGLRGAAPVAGGKVYICERTGPIYYQAPGPDGMAWQFAGGAYDVDARVDG